MKKIQTFLQKFPYDYFLLGIFFFLVVARFPVRTIGSNLDESWAAVLHYARVQNYTFGKDLVFTYGPLGYVVTQSFIFPELLPSITLWNVTLALGLSSLFVGFISSISDKKLAVSLSMLSLFLTATALPDGIFLLTIGLLLTPALIEKMKWRWLFFVIATLMAATLVLIKATLLLPASAVVGLHVGWCFQHKRFKEGLLLGLLFVVTVVGLWWVLGQDILALGAYLYNLVSISKDYTTAMSLRETNPLRLWGALNFVGVMLLSLLAVSPTLWARKNTWLNRGYSLLQFMVLAGITLLAWKHGFVRADGHTEIFMTYVLVITVVLVGTLMTRYSTQFKTAVLLVALSSYLVGKSISINSGVDLNLAQITNRVAENFTFLANVSSVSQQPFSFDQTEVATISAVLKDETVDAFSVNQAALIKAGLKYQPRPVFQSYTAYNQSLSQLNHSHLLSDNSAQNLYVEIFSIDGRYPLQDEPQSWVEILSNYTKVLGNNEYMLLKKNQQRREYSTRSISQSSVSFGETIQLNELPNITLLKIDFHQNILGTLLTLLYKPSVISMTVTFSDGNSIDYRLVPSLARLGFIIKPAVVTTAHLNSWTQNQPIPEITAVQFTQIGPSSYQNQIELELQEVVIDP